LTEKAGEMIANENTGLWNRNRPIISILFVHEIQYRILIKKRRN